MSDKMIETPKDVDTILIDEKSKDLSSLWSQLKESPNKWVWLGLGLVVVSLLMSLPYLFFWHLPCVLFNRYGASRLSNFRFSCYFY